MKLNKEHFETAAAVLWAAQQSYNELSIGINATSAIKAPTELSVDTPTAILPPLTVQVPKQVSQVTSEFIILPEGLKRGYKPKEKTAVKFMKETKAASAGKPATCLAVKKTKTVLTINNKLLAQAQERVAAHTLSSVYRFAS